MRCLFLAVLFFSLPSLSWQEKVVITGLDRPWAVVAGPDGNIWIYVAYSIHDRQGYRIQLNRFTYQDGQLQDRQLIFTGPGGESGHHFGCRLL